MVEYIKNGTNYGLFICEGGLNYDGGSGWFDANKNMKEIDFDDIDDGVNGIYLPFVREFRFTPNYKFNIITFFDQQAVNISLGEGYWIWTSNGRFGGISETTRNDKMADLATLMASHHDLTKEKLYMGYRKPSEIWEKFPNAGFTKKEYLPGILLLAEPARKAFQNFYSWKIAFRGMW